MTQISADDYFVETTQKDPNGGIVRAYTDARERQRAVLQVLNTEDVVTQSRYNALGEVMEVENAKGEVTKYAYDLLGRKLSVNHPDAGLTEFEYDNANNLLRRVTPDLRAWENADNADLHGFFIEYKYDYNRLTEVIYPKNVQNYVQYSYGAPDDKFNRAGRLVLVQDAAGGQEFFYDAFGNIVKEIRSVLINSSDLRTFVAENEYDVWGRIMKMTYPDGETVYYQYNTAGNLRSMYSEKDSRRYEIIRQLGYNEDEQKVFKLLGNGTKTTYTYEPERKRLATMIAGKGNTKLFDNQYTYDKVDNVLSIENNATIPITGLGGKTSNFYKYDEWNRLISANGTVETKNYNGSYTLDMQYDKLYNIVRKNQVDNVTNSKTQNWEYKYTDANHPNAPTEIGSKRYEYDANGNPVAVSDTVSGDYRRMIWDEENRLQLLCDNGNGNHYVYDHAGERVVKCQTGVQSVYIDGLQAGMLQNTRNYTVYVSSAFVVKNDGFTKHYYAGAERVLSKLGTGEFNNKFTATNKVLTAGNQNYIQRQQQLQKGIEEQYKELSIPPGNPTQKANLGQPETTGQPLPTVTGNYEVPRGWPREPKFNEKGDVPGPPVQFGEAITNENVRAGYGYTKNALEEADRYFYHPDHLGSTSIITDKDGIATQFVAYLPFGEGLVDEHSTRKEMPYKFSGKEVDEETGLSYFGARYYDAATVLWYGVDKLAEKYPNVGGYVYCHNNPIRLIDINGMFDSEADANTCNTRYYSGEGNVQELPQSGKWAVIIQTVEKGQVDKESGTAGVDVKAKVITDYDINYGEHMGTGGEQLIENPTAKVVGPGIDLNFAPPWGSDQRIGPLTIPLAFLKWSIDKISNLFGRKKTKTEEDKVPTITNIEITNPVIVTDISSSVYDVNSISITGTNTTTGKDVEHQIRTKGTINLGDTLYHQEVITYDNGLKDTINILK
jgi:RHS repeat-associated protein